MSQFVAPFKVFEGSNYSNHTRCQYHNTEKNFYTEEQLVVFKQARLGRDTLGGRRENKNHHLSRILT